MVVAFLLGSEPNIRHARLGLAVVVGGAAIVVYNLTTHTASQLVFIPLLFGVCWFLGFAVRQRGDQAAAAEERATRAERDRQASARIAVAEERARIARELHDIVAHAVSVMVLHTGAVRHRLPDDFPDEKEALRGVEETGRRALSEMRHLLGALRRDDEAAELESAAGHGRTGQPAAGGSGGGSAGPAGSAWGARSASRPDRPRRVPDRTGGPHERAEARTRESRRRLDPLRACGIFGWRSATTATGRSRATGSGTASWACASG